MCYIGRLSCGCVVAVTCPSPGHLDALAEDVARFIRQGYAAEHVTIEYMRQNLRPCVHKMEGVTAQMKLTECKAVPR
jgi:hypothetical protein